VVTGAEHAGRLPRAASRVTGVYLYFTPLAFLVALGAPSGYLVAISATFMLKDQLHASASQVAAFNFLTMLPVYFSVVFGFTRDLWNPFGMRDRGYLLLFAPITALIFCWMAYFGSSLAGLFAGILLAMVAFQFISASYSGLMALVGQEQLMSGRLAALLGIASMVPAIVGAVASGWFAARHTFLLVAALALAIALIGMWKPHAVFAHTYEQPLARAAGFWSDVKRLLEHKAIYPAVAVNFLSQFMPGMNTPMQYYLTDRLGAPDAVYGYYMAIFVSAFIPVYFLYAWLCKRVSLQKLLWWGTLIAIPQTVPLAFISSGEQAMMLALPLGLMGGIAAAAFIDLAMRSCPPGLQGTFMMLVSGAIALSTSVSNLLGSGIYSASPKHGFLYDVVTTVLFSTAILPLLRLIPEELITTADGERNPALEAGVWIRDEGRQVRPR